MKHLALAFTLLLSLVALAQTPEEMNAWEAYMTPSENHRWLASYDGEWAAKVKMWMDPKQPPTESTASSVNKMIYNGLYQISTHSGDMMGMPFEGQSITAYDNAKKKFISTWIDNMGSGIMIMEGNYDPKTKTMEMHGEMTDPMTSSIVKVKEVITYTSGSSYKFEMFMLMEGQEMKTMEIVYTRKK